MPQQLRQGATRRSVLLAGVSAATAIAAPAFAQGAYPNKPIEFIVPFPPGGGTDALARTLAEASRKYLPQSLVIINKAGASGGVGWAELVAARPDGYKIGIITVEITIIPHMGGVRFTSDDVTPIARLNADPATIAVRADSPIRTIEDLLAASKKAGGEGLKVGNAGPGSLGHLAAVVLSDKTGVPFTHVPYRGAGPGLLDLTGGHVDALSLTPPDMAAFVADGKVRPLAVMATQRIGSGWSRCPRPRSVASTWWSRAGAAWPRPRARRPRSSPCCARPSPRPCRSPRSRRPCSSSTSRRATWTSPSSAP